MEIEAARSSRTMTARIGRKQTPCREEFSPCRVPGPGGWLKQGERAFYSEAGNTADFADTWYPNLANSPENFEDEPYPSKSMHSHPTGARLVFFS